VIVIRNARILRATGVEPGTIAIEGDTVIAVDEVDDVDGARVIDARGAWVGPGFVDLHVHFRDPGQTWKEDIESGSRAAAAGGFTAVVTMPNTDPPVDGGRLAGEAIARAAGVDSVHVAVAGALTRGREGTEMADLWAMYESGIRVFTDDGDSVADAGLLRALMTYLSDLPGAVVAEHAEDRSLAGNGHMHEGSMSARHGVVGLPGLAEEVIVARDIAIARETGAHLHIQHVSTATSVDLIRQAREMGLAVTAEVTPHHLALDESSLSDLDPRFKMYPPLRSSEDRAAVVAGLREGVIDAVATDHAPHAAAEKAAPFEEAPRGVIGLETAAAVACRALEGDPVAFFSRMSTAPAGITGLARHGMAVEPGSTANLVVFDPERRWVPAGFVSKSSNSPFTGLELVGKVMATIYEGQISYEGDTG
jgi:dihydroorotase